MAMEGADSRNERGCPLTEWEIEGDSFVRLGYPSEEAGKSCDELCKQRNGLGISSGRCLIRRRNCVNEREIYSNRTPIPVPFRGGQSRFEAHLIRLAFCRVCIKRWDEVWRA